MGSYIAQKLIGKIRSYESETGRYFVLVEHVPFEVVLLVPHNPNFDRSLNEGEKLECVVMSEARNCSNLVPREIVGAIVKEGNEQKLYYDGVTGREQEFPSEWDYSPADMALHLMGLDERMIA